MTMKNQFINGQRLSETNEFFIDGFVQFQKMSVRIFEPFVQTTRPKDSTCKRRTVDAISNTFAFEPAIGGWSRSICGVVRHLLYVSIDFWERRRKHFRRKGETNFSANFEFFLVEKPENFEKKFVSIVKRNFQVFESLKKFERVDRSLRRRTQNCLQIFSKFFVELNVDFGEKIGQIRIENIEFLVENFQIRRKKFRAKVSELFDRRIETVERRLTETRINFERLNDFRKLKKKKNRKNFLSTKIREIRLGSNGDENFRIFREQNAPRDFLSFDCRRDFQFSFSVWKTNFDNFCRVYRRFRFGREVRRFSTNGNRSFAVRSGSFHNKSQFDSLSDKRKLVSFSNRAYFASDEPKPKVRRSFQLSNTTPSNRLSESTCWKVRWDFSRLSAKSNKKKRFVSSVTISIEKCRTEFDNDAVSISM